MMNSQYLKSVLRGLVEPLLAGLALLTLFLISIDMLWLDLALGLSGGLVLLIITNLAWRRYQLPAAATHVITAMAGIAGGGLAAIACGLFPYYIGDTLAASLVGLAVALMWLLLDGVAGILPQPRMRNPGWLLLCLLMLACPLGVVLFLQRPPPPMSIPMLPDIEETKDRISSDAMEALVAPAMRAVRADDRSQAEFLIERQIEAARIAHGAGSVREADILMSYGVELYSEGQLSDNRSIQQESLGYLRRAVTATRAAFGPRHPEVALALHSLADAEIDLAKANPPTTADAALIEAHAIRAAALGRHNMETIGTLVAIGALKGLPARVKANPVRLAEATAWLEKAIADAAPGRELGKFTRPALHAHLARIYLANGQRRKGLHELAQAQSGLAELDEAHAFHATMKINNVRSDFDLPSPTPPRR